MISLYNQMKISTNYYALNGASPEYDFNDELSPIGASFLAKLVESAQPIK